MATNNKLVKIATIMFCMILISIATATAFQITFPTPQRIPNDYDPANLVTLLHLNNSAQIANDSSPVLPRIWDITANFGANTTCAEIYDSQTVCGVADTAGGLTDPSDTLDNVFNNTAGNGMAIGGWVHRQTGTAGYDFLSKPYEDATYLSRFYTGTWSNENTYHRLGNSLDSDYAPAQLVTTWQHLIYNVNFTGSGNGFVTTYINGTEVNTEAFVSLSKFATTWSLGVPIGLNGFDGFFSEIFMFNRSLNLSEIEAIANGTLGLTSTPTVAGNMTVTAQSNQNHTAITNFNITINQREFTTTTGTITTQVWDNGTQFNISIQSTGFEDNTYTSQNSSTTFMANLTQNNLTFTNTWNYTTLRTGQNLTLNCTITNNQSLDYNITYFIINSEETTTKTRPDGQSFNYLINTSDFHDQLNWTCQVCTNYTCTNSTTLSTGNNTIDTVFTFTAINYLGETLSSAFWEFITTGFNETNNPLTILATSFISDTIKNTTEEINTTDLTYFNRVNSTNITINENTTNYNISLEPNQLTMLFFDNYKLSNTTGYVADITRRRGFENSSFVIIQRSLALGRVNVRFNMVNLSQTWVNHTQFYEYINDYNTHKTEEFSLIRDPDTTIYMQVLDLANAPIQDVTIRAEFSYNELNNWTNHTLMGQRLTDGEGYTFWFAETQTEVLFTISKTGYTPIEALVTIGDESFTKTTALTFYLEEDPLNETLEDAWMYIKRDFSNRSLDLSGTITAKGRSKVEIQTQYRIDQGLSRIDITEQCDTHNRCPFTIQSNIDYEFTSTDDVTLYVYLDNTLWRTINIQYNTESPNDVFNFKDLPNIVIVLLIIIPSAIIGLIFRNPNTGVAIFFALSIFASFINTSFIWVSFIALFYFVIKIVRKVIGE